MAATKGKHGYDDESLAVRAENAKKLAAGYGWGKRSVEIVSIAAFCYLWGTLFMRVFNVFKNEEVSPLAKALTFPSIVVAIATADFMSGLAHWGLDTWGSTETFAIGPIIRSFREHHVDQDAITRHDFIETNADNAMVAVPFMFLWQWVPIYANGVWTGTTVHSWFLILTLVVFGTNQCHKWSHQSKPGALARFLMSTGLLINAKHHQLHHCGKFDRAYCITAGWMNAPLDAIGFWRKLENAITAVTGAIPRENDLVLIGHSSKKH